MILFLIQSCASGDKKENISEVLRIESVHLFVNNDSILELNKIKFHISELEFQLDQIQSISMPITGFIIESDSEVKMKTIKQIEEILAADSVGSILYIHDEDSLVLYLVSPHSNQIRLILNKDGNLILNDEEISNDSRLLSQLETVIEKRVNPSIILIFQEGTSYDSYMKEKERIQAIVNKIDSTLKISEGVNKHYVRKK